MQPILELCQIPNIQNRDSYNSIPGKGPGFNGTGTVHPVTGNINWPCDIIPCIFTDSFIILLIITLYFIYVSLQLRAQNRRRKWHFRLNFWNDIIWTSPFPLNIRNGIIWTSPFPLNVRNAINWDGAFFKAFRSSEALISVLSKNARLYDNI